MIRKKHELKAISRIVLGNLISNIQCLAINVRNVSRKRSHRQCMTNGREPTVLSIYIIIHIESLPQVSWRNISFNNLLCAVFKQRDIHSLFNNKIVILWLCKNGLTFWIPSVFERKNWSLVVIHIFNALYF